MKRYCVWNVLCRNKYNVVESTSVESLPESTTETVVVEPVQSTSRETPIVAMQQSVKRQREEVER